MPEGLLFLIFYPLSRKLKGKFTLRPPRLERSGR
jgi:hypothetical protein